MNYTLFNEKKLGEATIIWKWQFECGSLELQPGGEYAMVELSLDPHSSFSFSFFKLWNEDVLPVINTLEKVNKLTTIADSKKEEAIFKKLGFFTYDEEIKYMIKTI